MEMARVYIVYAQLFLSMSSHMPTHMSMHTHAHLQQARIRQEVTRDRSSGPHIGEHVVSFATPSRVETEEVLQAAELERPLKESGRSDEQVSVKAYIVMVYTVMAELVPMYTLVHRLHRHAHRHMRG